MSILNLSNVDFKFRRGSKEALLKTPLLNGSLNFTKDTRELFVDIDDLRFQISSIIFDAGTETAIRAIIKPEYKLYLASDTGRLLFFNKKDLVWVVVGNHTALADIATKAIYDNKGNQIDSYYYPVQSAASDIETINTRINNLSNTVGNITRFGIVVLLNETELPEVGTTGIIYFIPVTAWNSYIGANNTPTETSQTGDNFVELLWIVDNEFGGYFEIIGDTTVDLSNYYTKADVDNKIEVLNIAIQQEITNVQTTLTNSINALRNIINGLGDISGTVANAEAINSLNNTVSTLSNRVDGINNTLNTATGDISTIKEDIATINQGIDTVESNVTTIQTSYVQSALPDEN